jgi:hypothetical protein
VKSSTGDQTKIIQDAFNKVSKSGGGVVSLAVGEYRISSPGPTIPDGTSLHGNGPSMTTLVLKDGSFSAITIGIEVSDPKLSVSVDILQ